MPHTPRNLSFASPALEPQSSIAAHTIAFVAAAGAAALLLAWFFALRPALDAYRATRATSLDELQNRLVNRRASVAKLKAIEERFSSITPEERAKLEAALPNDAGAPDLIANMEAVVRLSDLTLVSVNIGAPGGAPSQEPGGGRSLGTAPPGVKTIPVSVRVEGINYLTLKKVLQRIETNVRLLDIPSLSFEAAGDGLTFSLVTYAYRPPQVVQ